LAFLPFSCLKLIKRGVFEILKYRFRFSVLMMVLVVALVWVDKGQEVIISTIIGSMLAYWLGSK